MDGRCDLARIVADARRLADFDVLCLQEVADNFPELRGTRGANQFAELATLLPGYAAIEGVAVDMPDGQGRRKRFGNMILSRLPVGQVLRWTLPWEADHTATCRAAPRSGGEAPFGPVRVMTTHLEYSSPGCGAPRSRVSASASQRLCPRREPPRARPRHLRHPADRALRHPHRRLQHEAGGPDEASHIGALRDRRARPSSTPGRRSIGMRRIRPRSACSIRPTAARIAATSSS